VRGIPTLILFKNGKEIQRFVGVQQEKQLLSAIEAALSE
jgi:thioredoxin-like negative regulator of GroEL